MKSQKKVFLKGATMRLGSYSCTVSTRTNAYKAYQKKMIYERHRHRYEVNNKYINKLVDNGLIVSGENKKLNLVEMIEIKDHPFKKYINDLFDDKITLLGLESEFLENVDIDDLAYRSKQLLHGVQTAIDLPTEMKGRVPNRQFMNKLYGRWGWSKGALLNISIGQGELLVTPLQMAAYINLLATRGSTYPLHLVQQNKELIESPMVSKRSWRLIGEYMEKTISNTKGTGRRSDPKIQGLKIAGKTGTAENPHGEPHAWFLGYGEKNGEMISVVIMIENGGGGGSVAAPLAKKVFKQYFSRTLTNLVSQ